MDCCTLLRPKSYKIVYMCFSNIKTVFMICLIFIDNKKKVYQKSWLVEEKNLGRLSFDKSFKARFIEAD